MQAFRSQELSQITLQSPWPTPVCILVWMGLVALQSQGIAGSIAVTVLKMQPSIQGVILGPFPAQAIQLQKSRLGGLVNLMNIQDQEGLALLIPASMAMQKPRLAKRLQEQMVSFFYWMNTKYLIFGNSSKVFITSVRQAMDFQKSVGKSLVALLACRMKWLIWALVAHEVSLVNCTLC